MRVRIHIREQLCFLITIFSLLALMVVAVTTWIESHGFIIQTRSETLQVEAQLKAAQIAQALDLYQDIAQSVSTRTDLRGLLRQYNNGNTSSALFNGLNQVMVEALAGEIEDNLLLQGAIFPHTARGHLEGQAADAIANVTGTGAYHELILPYNYPNGSAVYLGAPVYGYPPALYPNFTWHDGPNNTSYIGYHDRTLVYNSTILFGPMFLQRKTALVSMTVAINEKMNSTSDSNILGWLTVVLNAQLMFLVGHDGIGLGTTGEMLVVAPTVTDNLFVQPVLTEPASRIENIPVRYILPPWANKTFMSRHSIRALDGTLPFLMKDYKCVLEAYADNYPDQGTILSTHNEQGYHVACGFALLQTPLVDWMLMVEFSFVEAYSPIRDLRNSIIICIFSVIGVILVVCPLLAHEAVKPIQALKTATLNSIMTYEAETFEDTASSESADSELAILKNRQMSSNGFVFMEKKRTKKPKLRQRRQFQIPQKVPDRKYLIQDELTELINTFNDMSEELTLQYGRLEDRVKTRTIELEQSRDLARAADESKTLFIANISHELRTPLNGIIGMCAVAMQEDEVHTVRQSLNIIYKSSDLLLHLLNDLLTFSRNSYGQNLSIEEGIFNLADIGAQLISFFEKQTCESKISLKVVFLGPEDRQHFDDISEDAIQVIDIGSTTKRVRSNVLARGPANTGPLRDMALQGDKNRIIQVLMNLVSNSLKFTQAGGMIEIRIRCCGFTKASPSQDDAVGTTALSSATTVSSAETYLDFEFQVEDTGPGVPEHLQTAIFNPFVQGDLALSRKHGGTGLGLAICTQLATLMRGTINLKSTVGIGSTFTLSIPLQYAKEGAPSITGSLALASRRGSLRPPSLGDSRQEKDPGLLMPTTRRGSLRPPSLGDSGLEKQPSTTEGAATKPKAETPRLRPEMASVPGRIEQPISEEKDIVNTAGPELPQPEPPKSEAPKPEPESSTPKPSTLAPPSQPPNLKILVAEDNKVNQEVIKRMLKLEKLTDVKVAEDGQQALERIQKSLADGRCSYQLVFMDVQMPNMDGIESTRCIRKLGVQVPIVALTAFDHETNREACKEAGMNAFLPKPLKRTALKKVLEEFRPTAE